MLVERGIHDVNDACVSFAAAISFLTAANIATVVVSTKATRQSYRSSRVAVPASSNL